MNAHRAIDEEYERPSARLEPGTELCDCGRVREVEDRHTCVHCGHDGCSACMEIVNDTGDDDANENWVCGQDCAVGWLEELGQSEERSHILYQDWLGRRIAEARARGNEAKERAA